MPQPKLKAFLEAHQGTKQGTKSPKSKANDKSQHARPKQARLGDMPGVVKLPKMSGHATEAELHRLLADLQSNSSDEALIQTMKQLACYELTTDQLEAVPLGKRVRKLRQHTSPQVQQQAARLLAKMRQDVRDACNRAAKAKPIVAMLKATKVQTKDVT